MRRVCVWLGLSFFVGGCAQSLAQPVAEPLCRVVSVIPDAVVDLRYATAHNFTGQVLYPDVADCYLRKSVAQKLAVAATELRKDGLRLVLWDCYRPLSVQKRLFERVPDERYVANPKKGSRHNRGAAVDLTLADAQGRPVSMPTAFDAFGPAAHRDFFRLPKDVLAHRARLEQAMKQAGFLPLPTEWWHFDAADFQHHPMADVSFETLRGRLPSVP